MVRYVSAAMHTVWERGVLCFVQSEKNIHLNNANYWKYSMISHKLDPVKVNIQRDAGPVNRGFWIWL